MDIPGFFDLQVNGYKGIDFSSPDLSEEEFVFASRALLNKGMAGFLPTIITSPASTFERNLRLMANVMQDDELGRALPGIHVEGPFISANEGARGAHNAEWVKPPDIGVLEDLYRWSGDSIKLLTMAADVDGATTLCRYATEKLGITVSLGHHMATEDDLKKMVAAGARSLTHLGNGIPQLLPRHHNPLWAGIANDDLIAMVIADGHHLPASVIKTIIRTKGMSNVIAVSDASPIAGLPPGKYNTLGNDVILTESGRLYNPNTGYLVGSSSSLLDCMNYLLSLDMFTPNELYDIGLYNPLQLIDVDPATLHGTGINYNDDRNEFDLADEQ